VTRACICAVFSGILELRMSCREFKSNKEPNRAQLPKEWQQVLRMAIVHTGLSPRLFVDTALREGILDE
jgi:hypothetical protein